MVRSHPYTVNEVVAALDSLDVQEVSVAGVLQVEFEGNSLWHSPKSERKPDYESSLWAEFDHAALGLSMEQLREFDGRHVVASAVVDRSFTGHLSLWPGALLIRSLTKSRAGAT